MKTPYWIVLCVLLSNAAQAQPFFYPPPPPPFAYSPIYVQPPPTPPLQRPRSRLGDSVDHNLVFSPQQTMVWCWVATAKMLIEGHTKQPAPTQCEMLALQYNAPCCIAPHMCSRVGHIVEIQALVARFGIRLSNVEAPPTPKRFFRKLRGGPIGIHTIEGGGHFVVAGAMQEHRTEYGSTWDVTILDPFRGVYRIDYEQLRLKMDAILVIH